MPAEELFVELALDIDATGREQLCDAPCVGMLRVAFDTERQAPQRVAPLAVDDGWREQLRMLVEKLGKCVDVIVAHGAPCPCPRRVRTLPRDVLHPGTRR